MLNDNSHNNNNNERPAYDHYKLNKRKKMKNEWCISVLLSRLLFCLKFCFTRARNVFSDIRT